MCSQHTQNQHHNGDAQHVVAAHPEQGWNLLCDGSIHFDDTGELHPDGSVVPPCRVPSERLTAAA
ncbi:DUF5999 family protein [Streptomyces sp. NPDC026672]|uniref:DUF5999 family protein n=1 Tax=unclassified Streptomyces TaxID=2593676 RepID=UPI0033D10F8A